MTKEPVFVRQHKEDPEIIEVFSMRKTSQGPQLVLWAAVHLDLLDSLGFDWATDDLADFQLALVSK
tara:strand:+ start:230 stop:427 length:198 start_codon:yes stop_codon:yes gene_type:complete